VKRTLALSLVMVALGALLAIVVRRGGDGPRALRAPATLLGGSARERAQAKIEEGEALEQLDRLDEAASAYAAAVEADTAFAIAALRLGALRLVTGDRAGARDLLERALRLDPASADAQFHVGFLREEEGDVAAAERAYREAVRLDSTFADAANNLGHLLIGVGRAAEAAALLEEARRRNPENQYLAKNLGRAYARQARWDDARPLVERSISLAEHDPDVVLDLACVRRALGDEAQAQRLLRQYAGSVRDPVRRAAGDSLFALAAPRRGS
jgi:Tfp pilus assembly protein PilF